MLCPFMSAMQPIEEKPFMVEAAEEDVGGEVVVRKVDDVVINGELVMVLPTNEEMLVGKLEEVVEVMDPEFEEVVTDTADDVLLEN